MIRRALVHQLRNPERKRAVYDVRMSRHPTDVCGAPEDVGIFQIEHPFRRRIYLRQVSAGGVQNALRFAGRSRRIEDVQRILRVHRFGRTLRRRLGHQLGPPQIAARLDGDGLTGAPQQDDVFDARRRAECLVSVDLQRDDRTATVAAVGRDQDFGAGVVDPVAQRLGGEAAEDHRMDSANPCACQHRHSDFRDHREVDRDAVAATHPQPLQDVGELVDVGIQLTIGDAPHLSRRFSFPDQRHAAAPAGAHVAVQAVHRRVELAAEEPLGVRRLPLQHAVPRSYPFELLRPVRPITFRICPGAVVGAGVMHVCLLLELIGRGEAALLVEEGFDPVSRHSSGILRKRGTLASCAAPFGMRQGAGVSRLTWLPTNACKVVC